MKGTSFSLALDYYIRASFGYTYKSINSTLAPFGRSGRPGMANFNAHDIGFIFQIPIYKLLREFKIMRNHKFSTILPYFDTGFYYSKTNIGGKIVYIDPAQVDPLPRNLTLGINFSTGLIYKRKYISLNLISFKWAREVNDILVKRSPDGGSDYLSGLNDIKFFDNLILGNSSDKIFMRRGYELNFGDFYFIRRGKYEDLRGKFIMETEGWGINYLQPIKILISESNINYNVIQKIISSLYFEKHHSKYITESGYPMFGTEYECYTIGLRNFTFD